MAPSTSDLGLDDGFRQSAAGLLQPGHSIARVTAVDRDAFLVRNTDAESRAVLAGTFRHTIAAAADLPCVGDWVCIQCHPSGGPALIHAVVPRKTFLRRKSPGKAVDVQMIASNIDAALIVQACDYDFNMARLDRYMVMVHDGAVEPWVILTKTDLVPPEQLEQTIEQVRHARGSTCILPISNTTGEGLHALCTRLIPGATYCVLGSSGVGKTTLINRLIGRDALHTRVVSATGEGVHTTVRRQLLVLDSGAMLIDTPGMRELGLLATSDGLDDAFAEIREAAATCRFANCTHTNEPGCAVLQALEQGDLDEDRYQSYRKLRKETEYHELTSLEKRRKDKSFGRYIKSVKKSLQK